MPEPRAYIRDGAEIYRRSFGIIRAEADLVRFSAVEERVAVRIIHACGMTDIARDIAMSPGFAERARQALRGGAPILCDSKMVANGITRGRLPAGNDVAGAALDADANTVGAPTIAIRGTFVVPKACATMGAAAPATRSETPTIVRLRWK